MNSLPLSPLVMSRLTPFYWENRCLQNLRNTVTLNSYLVLPRSGKKYLLVCIYKLTHSASELSGFTCTSSLTMNEKFPENFEFIVSELVQVNPDNSPGVLTF